MNKGQKIGTEEFLRSAYLIKRLDSFNFFAL
jgi:hypothetical protein